MVRQVLSPNTPINWTHVPQWSASPRNISRNIRCATTHMVICEKPTRGRRLSHMNGITHHIKMVVQWYFNGILWHLVRLSWDKSLDLTSVNQTWQWKIPELNGSVFSENAPPPGHGPRMSKGRSSVRPVIACDMKGFIRINDSMTIPKS